MAWSPTGDRIAAVGNNGVGGICNVTTGNELAGVPSHGDRSLAIGWSKNGRARMAMHDEVAAPRD